MYINTAVRVACAVSLIVLSVAALVRLDLRILTGAQTLSSGGKWRAMELSTKVALCVVPVAVQILMLVSLVHCTPFIMHPVPVGISFYHTLVHVLAYVRIRWVEEIVVSGKRQRCGAYFGLVLIAVNVVLAILVSHSQIIDPDEAVFQIANGPQRITYLSAHGATDLFASVWFLYLARKSLTIVGGCPGGKKDTIAVASSQTLRATVAYLIRTVIVVAALLYPKNGKSTLAQRPHLCS